MKLISGRRRFPRGLQVATVGGASVRTLERFGITGVLAPQGRFDSESLLVLPALAAVDGLRVVIFRGEGGRELLADTLRRRGAEVSYVACYRRQRPLLDPAPVLALWHQGGLQAVTVSSREIVDKLCALLGPEGLARLRTTPLFAPHERIAAAARQHGLEQVIVTAPGDDGLVTGMIEWFGQYMTENPAPETLASAPAAVPVAPRREWLVPLTTWLVPPSGPDDLPSQSANST